MFLLVCFALFGALFDIRGCFQIHGMLIFVFFVNKGRGCLNGSVKKKVLKKSGVVYGL